MFQLKDKTKYRSSVVYLGVCETRKEVSYIGETKQIADLRWKQHNDPNHDSEPAKYISEHPSRKLTWKVLAMSSKNTVKRKIHEALFITKLKPSLNKKVKMHKLVLFRNGVT